MGLSLALLRVLALFVLVGLYKFMLTLRTRTLYSTLPLDTDGDGHPLLFPVNGEVIFPRKRPLSVGAALSVTNDLHLEEDERIHASNADIVDDTIGDVVGMKAVFIGSSAEVTCAAQVLIASSDALENSWKAGRYPVLIFSMVLRRVS